MKADDKKLIYTLLKTADAYECGFTRPQFAGEPEFADDENTDMSFPGVTRESAQGSDVQIVTEFANANVAGSSPTMTHISRTDILHLCLQSCFFSSRRTHCPHQHS